MGTQPIAVFQRANAVRVNSASLLTHCGHVEVFFLLFAKHRRRDERHDLIQQIGVACCHNIVVNHERQKIEVVGDPRANADPGRRVPPVLDIALLELPCRRSQDLRPRLCRSAVDQGHHILQLISKAVRPTGLVERGAGPNAASQDLINKPAVEHQVDAAIGRSHVQRVQVAVPLLLYLRQSRSSSMGLCVFANKSMNFLQTVRLTQDKNHFPRLARSQRQFGRHCRAGIEGWACAAGQPDTLQGCGH